ncbi:unnamed protein product [Phytophthora fragariaefolia]|uniref:Unnamed protein product n=1 Tax=Phytophthora fragariaefolia TaxID=1490495 RepID=A0A9W6XWU8_9STRA|nr:unnamed protein product [Phytophthora fragariaefolia]
MQGFIGALNHYSRFIQNMEVYGVVLYQLKDADFADGGDLAAAKLAFAELKTKVANAPILRHFDSAKEVHIMLFADAWALSSTPLQPQDGLLHPVRFCGRVLKENKVNYHPAEKEVLALLHKLKMGHTLVAGKTLHDYTRFSTLEWVFTSKSLYGRAVSFAVLHSPYNLKVKRIREHDADFAELLQATVTPHIGLDDSLSHLAPPSKNSATVRLDPELLYAHVPRDFIGHVLSFDGSAKTEKNGGYVDDSRLAIQQSMGVMACKKETLQLEQARHKKRTDQLSSVRYLHVLRYYNAAADSLATEALESKIGRVELSSDRKTDLKELHRVAEILYTSTDSADSGEPRAEMTVMTRRQTRRVHFEDEANKDSAGISQNTGLHDKEANSPNLRAEGLQFESPRAPKRVRRVEDQAEVEVSEDRIPDATDIDPAVVQAERRRRISKAQDEQLRWADLKVLLRGELDSLTHRRAQNASKIADSFVLSDHGLLYYQGQWKRRAEPDTADMSLRLVVPTTMVDEVLHRCHNSIEGGHQGIVRTFHRVKADFYWVGLYADVSKHVQTCEDGTKEYRLADKAQRAEAHNARLSGKEKRSLPESTQLTRERSTDNEDADSEDEPAEPQRSLFQAGDQVWLFMERVRPGLKKKLDHRWHGPLRVKKKVEEFAYELELRDKSGENDRFDFNEELLPEDSWELSDTSDKYEVEAIPDDMIPNSTSTSRPQRLFKVKWVGYDEPPWEPLSNLSCGSLLFDYLRNKKRERRLQMVQVAGEN